LRKAPRSALRPTVAIAAIASIEGARGMLQKLLLLRVNLIRVDLVAMSPALKT
jgi:hypothetical protein